DRRGVSVADGTARAARHRGQMRFQRALSRQRTCACGGETLLRRRVLRRIRHHNSRQGVRGGGGAGKEEYPRRTASRRAPHPLVLHRDEPQGGYGRSRRDCGGNAMKTVFEKSVKGRGGFAVSALEVERYDYESDRLREE